MLLLKCYSSSTANCLPLAHWTVWLDVGPVPVAAMFLTEARDVEAVYCVVLALLAVRAGARLGGDVAVAP